jgi:hypothetical protein
MKNQIYQVMAILGIFVGLAVANAQAQAPSKVEVNIPFEFSAAKTTLQAGIYSIKRMSGNQLALRTSDGKTAVVLYAPVTINSRDPKSAERLVFNKDGEQYFLSQIWLTADTGREVWTKRESQKTERVEIALRVK